jgi:hypothetical protein
MNEVESSLEQSRTFLKASTDLWSDGNKTTFSRAIIFSKSDTRKMRGGMSGLFAVLIRVFLNLEETTE